MLYGILNLSFWGYVIAGLIFTQLSIAGVTIYLHRNQTHRALDLHPFISHIFRFWLWASTGMETGQWVAIHRKHHATTDVEGDPHSPAVEGIKKVFWQGAELYRAAKKNREIIEKYSFGTPDDWVERNIYTKYSSQGPLVMLLIELFLFGIPGVTIFAIQMMWIPIWAAGVVNGIGHFRGYRNFECPDTSTNVFPWGFWIGGEELHNNHHAFASSAKFSVKWWEFDIGWMYIKILSFFGLATVKKLPPRLVEASDKSHVDIDTVKAVVTNRFQITANYYNDVLRPMLIQVKRNQVSSEQDKQLVYRAGELLKREQSLLTPKSSSRLKALLDRYEQLRIAYDFRESLQYVWLKTASSQTELVESLQAWCKQAEESGLERLQQFSVRLKGYVLHSTSV